MKFAMCNEMFEAWPWERTCAYLRELGYTGLEIAPFTLAPRATQITSERRKQTRAVAEKHGLHILGIHWLLAKLEPPDLYVTHPDRAVREKTADYFTALVDLCADLGGSVMVIGSPKQRNLMPGVARDQAMEYAKEVFSKSLPTAARRNVTLAIEPLGRAETDFLTTAQDGVELIEKIGHPNFRLHLDVKAMSDESKPIPQIIRESAKHLVHFHVNDPNLLGPGMGDVKYEPIIEALREVKYEGWLSVEAFDFRPGPEKIAEESMRYLRQVTR